MPAAAAAAKSLQSCSTLCDPIDGSPPGFPVPGILQARRLEWVAVAFSDCHCWCLLFPVKVKVKVAQSCPTLSDPMDYSPPGSSIHGSLQARRLEWVAMPSSRDLPDPGIEPVSSVSHIGRQLLHQEHHWGRLHCH